MFKTLRMPIITLKRPAPARISAEKKNAANIWEAARMAEKVNDNYCIPTPEGFEVCYNHKVKKITGDQAANVQRSVPAGVDPCDWILYIYSLEG